MSRAAATIASAVALLAAGACGGDDGPSREDFVAEADAICERFNGRLAQLNEARPNDFAELKEVLASGVAISRDALAALERLEAPDEVAGDFDAFLAAGRRQTDLLDQARRAGSLEDASRILQEDAPRVGQERAAAAAEIGFEECGSTVAS